MSVLIWIGLAAVAGFIAGMLVGRRNPSIANTTADLANRAEAAAKSAANKG